jgi:hypothetical protein
LVWALSGSSASRPMMSADHSLRLLLRWLLADTDALLCTNTQQPRQPPLITQPIHHTQTPHSSPTPYYSSRA